jgi:hypothetical protein
VGIIMALRERIQNPPPSEFKMEDLVWTNHVIHGKGRHNASKLIVIPWDMLINFIHGKQHIIHSTHAHGEYWHGTMVNGFRYALGSREL